LKLGIRGLISYTKLRSWYVTSVRSAKNTRNTDCKGGTRIGEIGEKEHGLERLDRFTQINILNIKFNIFFPQLTNQFLSAPYIQSVF
jgi:hypothetical protein